jgi:hypothetical protein
MSQETVLFIRHSKAGYATYKQILDSEVPQQPTDPKNQVLPDLPQEGIDLAQREAKQLFFKMDSGKEALFFISGNQARVLETAKIYKEIAKEKGFTVIRPEHHRNPLVEQMNEDEIRVVQALSLHQDNPFWSAVYYPSSRSQSINWEKIDPEIKTRWDAARGIVMSNDEGIWGANFLYHSNKLKKDGLLPNDQNTVGELFKKQFPQIIHLVRFAAKKAAEGFDKKKVICILFGNENYFLEVLEQYFAERIDNCEVIRFDVNPDDSIIVTKKGKSTTVSPLYH